MVGISSAIRRATPDHSMGVPPPARLWGHAHCRWDCRWRSGRRVPLVCRLRMGGLLPGRRGAEPRGWLLVRHYRSLVTSPSVSRRAATSPRSASSSGRGCRIRGDERTPSALPRARPRRRSDRWRVASRSAPTDEPCGRRSGLRRVPEWSAWGLRIPDSCCAGTMSSRVPMSDHCASAAVPAFQ